MPADLSTAAEILKIDYEGPIRDQLNHATVLLDVIQRDLSKKRFRGSDVHVPLHTGRAAGIGGRAAGGTLPTAGNQEFGLAVYNVKYLYGRGQVDGPSMVIAADEGAFVSLLKTEMDGLRRDLRDDLLRQVWHDGSGILTDAATDAVSDTTLTVADTKFLKIGQHIDIITRATGNVDVSDRTILTIPSATTATVSGAAFTTTTAQAVLLTGSYTGTTDRTVYAINGILGLVNDLNPGADTTAGAADNFGSASTNYIGGINRTANPFWQANRVTQVAALDETLNYWQQAYDETDIESGMTPGVIMTSHAVRRLYGSVLTPLRRIDETLTLQGGWTGTKFGNSAIMTDRYASWPNDPANTATTDFDYAYFIEPSTLEWQVASDWEWMNDDGSTLSRVANQDAYEFTMRSYQNLIAIRPNGNAILNAVA